MGLEHICLGNAPLAGDAFMDQRFAVDGQSLNLALNSARNLSHFAKLLVEKSHDRIVFRAAWQ